MSQWRNNDFKFIQPMVQIFAKLTGSYSSLQVFIGGDYNTYINRNLFGTSYFTDFPLLYGPQQKTLYIIIQVTDLIEE
ncbi:hypothetical protein D9M68_841540 [compost metagenome]